MLSLLAHPDFLDSLSRRTLIQQTSVERCLNKLKARAWDVGLRVKRLRGFQKRVWEARSEHGDRVIFMFAHAAGSDNQSGAIYILDIVDHDHVKLMRRRDFSATARFMTLVENSAFVEEDIEIVPSDLCELWSQDEVRQTFDTGSLYEFVRRHIVAPADADSLIASHPDQIDLWLTEEQVKVVRQHGHAVVSGTAGSGKSTMALQRLLLASPSAGRKLYVTANPNLVDYVREELFPKLLPQHLVDDDAFTSQFVFRSFNELAREHLGSAIEHFPRKSEVGKADFEAAYRSWQMKLPASVVWGEIQGVIKGAWLNPKTPYYDRLGYQALGRKKAYDSIDERETIYACAKRYHSWLIKKNAYDQIDLARQALANRRAAVSTGYSAIVCDEVQDLTELQLDFLFHLYEGPDGIFITGDLNQAINSNRFRWDEIMLAFRRHNMAEPSRHQFSVNFRSKGLIVAFSEAVLDLRRRLLGDSVTQVTEAARQSGQIPVLFPDDLLLVKRLICGLDARFAVLVPTETVKRQLKEETKFTFIFTVDEVKGLEFDQVILWDIFDDAAKLWKEIVSGRVSPGLVPLARQTLNRLYVGATRPRHALYLIDPLSRIDSLEELAGSYTEGTLLDLVSAVGKSGLSPGEWVDKGHYYYDHGFFEEARVCFGHVERPELVALADAGLLLRQGNWPEAARCFSALGRHSEAAEAYEKAELWEHAATSYARCSRALEQWYCQAKLASAQGHWEAAAQLFRKTNHPKQALDIIRHSSSQKLIAAYEAEYLIEQRQWKKAARLLEEATEWSWAAEVWERAREWQAAAQAFAAAGNAQDARRCTAMLPPKKQESLWEAIWKMEQSGQYTDAAAAWEALGEVDEAERAQLAADNELPRLLQSAHALLDRKQAKEATSAFQEAIRRYPICAEAFYGLGLTLMSRRLVDEAKNAFQKVISLDPNHVEAYKKIAEALLIKARYQEALPYFKKVVALSPEDSTAVCNLGICYQQIEDFDEALELYERAIRMQPDTPSLYFNLGNTLLKMGRSAEAVSQFLTGIHHAPDMAIIYGSLAAAYSNLGEIDNAIASLERAVSLDSTHLEDVTDLQTLRMMKSKLTERKPDFTAEDFRRFKEANTHSILGGKLAEKNQLYEAEEEFRQAINADEGFGSAYVNLGALITDQGRYTEAQALYEKALLVGYESVMLRNNYAKCLLQMGLKEEGLAQLQEALRIDPKNELVLSNIEAAQVTEAKRHYRKAQEFELEGKTGNAIREMRKVVNLEPNDVDALSDLGLFLSKQNDPEAFLWLQKAIEMNPNHLPARQTLGTLLAERGDLEDALSHYKVALSASPNDYECLKNIANVQIDLAGRYGDRAQYEEAINNYEKAKSIRPHHALAYVNLGQAYLKYGVPGRAVNEYYQAIQIDPQCAMAHHNLGMALTQIGQWQEARDAYIEALRIIPNSADTHFCFGDLIMTLGEYSEALTHFSKALLINPRDTEALAKRKECLRHMNHG